MKTKISYIKLQPEAVVPKPATEMSGGMDLTAVKIIVGNGEAVVYTGLAMQPPPGYMIRIAPRSSITKTPWVLQNSPALGDADYTGEYILKFRRIPTEYKGFINKSFPYGPGDRCAQMWLEKIIPVEFEEVDVLPNKTDRIGGFGSTNK